MRQRRFVSHCVVPPPTGQVCSPHSLPIYRYHCTVTTTGRITNVYDKSKGALIVFECVSTTPAAPSTSEAAGGSVTVLAVNRSSIFVRGIGGFGGDRGPAMPAWMPPGSTPAPDGVGVKLAPPHAVDAYATPPSAALLYRLNGDTNPLHADAELAAMGGFPRPILHGLASFGAAGENGEGG